MNSESADSTDPSYGDSTSRESPKAIRFAELAAGRNEVTIEFEGQLYRLRATRNGRLLLNK